MSPPKPKTPHYGKLREYVHAVVRDMMVRGAIRRRYHGQPLEDVLRLEGRAVLMEVEGDLIAIGAELGISALGALRGVAEELLFQGEDVILDFLGLGKKQR